MTVATVTMRRSCHFCRLRKIRCSGQTICSACRERNIDCVYEVETAKGRPRANGRRGAKGTPSRDSPYGTPEPNTPQTDITSVPDRFNMGFPALVPDIASDMERMFNEAFGEEIPPTLTGANGLNPYQQGLRSFTTRIRTNPLESSDNGDSGIMNYQRLLGSISYEMVEMLVNRFGHIGCDSLGESRAGFFSRSLAKDRTSTMFDLLSNFSALQPQSSSTSPTSSSPKSQRITVGSDNSNLLADLDYHKAVQMTDVWFSAHPLSCIVSKTLFLRSLRRNEKKDEILLAIILADARVIHEDQSVPNSETLFAWAASRLRQRSAADTGLSTAQALTLLGWYELCRSSTRRAICYLGYASRIIQRIQIQIAANEKEGLNHSVQVNGVNEMAVEKELVLNIYWVTYSLILWGFMQMDQSFLDILPSFAPAALPPVDGTESVVVALDIASDNISTLQSQRRSIKELWPISNITSNVSHIYASYPRELAASDHGHDWQSRSLDQLRRLINQPQDLEALCAKVRLILVSASNSLSSAVKNARSKAVVLTAIHSIVVHMLFPRAPLRDQELPVVTAEVLENFFRSAVMLLECCAAVAAPDGEYITSSYAQACSSAETIALALDTCSRAMAYFLLRAQDGSPAESKVIESRGSELLGLASRFYDFSKNETFVFPGGQLRVVKKSLKRIIRTLQSTGRSMSAPPISTADLAPVTSPRPNSRAPSTTRSRSTVSPPAGEAENEYCDTSSGLFREHCVPSQAIANSYDQYHDQYNNVAQHYHNQMNDRYVPEVVEDIYYFSDTMNVDFVPGNAALLNQANCFVTNSTGSFELPYKVNATAAANSFVTVGSMAQQIQRHSPALSGDVSPYHDFD